MKKLIEALRVIRDTCDQHPMCRYCPLYVDGVCKVEDLPCDWEIVEVLNASLKKE